MSITEEPISPRASALPALPDDDPLTEAQWKTLFSIADAFIPSITARRVRNRGETDTSRGDKQGGKETGTSLSVEKEAYDAAVTSLRDRVSKDEKNSQASAEAFLAESATSIPAFRVELRRVLGLYVAPSARKQLGTILNLLDTRPGSYLLTGYTISLGKQPVQIRESILQGWRTARLALFRRLYRSLSTLARLTWIRTSVALPRQLGCPRMPTGMKPGKGFEYDFLQFPPGEEPEIIETDVVVVGSGCGGGVSAKNLAEAGHRVIVVEKGRHWTPDHYPMADREGWNHLFMHGGFLSSDDSSSGIVAGETWGGGGTVNWSASLQTQAFVRQEWADGGLPFFTSAAFQECLDRVCDRMGVSAAHIEHNKNNAAMLEGARRLGYAHKAVPQNTGGNRHYCGHCTFGCGSCEKQGPVVSFLPDAARAGAHFIEGFHAEDVVFSTTDGKKIATGVRGTWSSRDEHGGVASAPLVQRKIQINAKRVIVSAGSMQSPLLLLRSGLTNHHIGRNLHIHPVAAVGALHDEPIDPWDGGILTSVVTELENLDGKGHGVKLEASTMLPSFWLIYLDWTGGLPFKLAAGKMKYMTGHISLARDRDSGQVYADPVDGRVRLRYTPSEFDRRHILEGVVALAKMQYANGAREIFTSIPGMSTFVRPASPPAPSDDKVSHPQEDPLHSGTNDPFFTAWITSLRRSSFPLATTTFGSAHQMGTCRMSSSPATGVVDPVGKVWDVHEGLYVADASVFPSASGVNPMVTNMAIADWISRGVARGMK